MIEVTSRKIGTLLEFTPLEFETFPLHYKFKRH